MNARPVTAPARRRLVSLGVVALLVAGLVGAGLVGPASAKPKGRGSKTVDATSSGFPVAKTKKAAGAFLGARKVGADVVYRIDPDKRATSTGFLPGVYTDTLAGSGKAAPSTEATSRAAWIVAKYGSYPSKVQNAAVEVALDDLLVGGPWAVKGKKAKARLGQVKKSARKKILKQVDQMLKGAATFASAYQVSSTTTPTVLAGGPTVTTVKVTTTATGIGVPNLAVSFAYPGAAPQTVRTGPDGVAAATFTTSGEGPRTTAVTIANVPENRLLVLNPVDGRSSRVVVAAQKTDRGLTGVTQVTRKHPVISVAGATRSPGQAFGSRAVVAGTTPGARLLTANLYGPFAQPGAAACAGTAKATGTVAVANDGTFDLPAYSTSNAGSYIWAVFLPETVPDAPAAACTGVVTVLPNMPSLSVNGGGPRSVGQGFGSSVAVSGSGGGDRQLSATLYGPFTRQEDAQCGGNVAGSGGVTVSGNGLYALPNLSVGTAGWYAWLATMPATANDAAALTCGGVSVAKASPTTSSGPAGTLVINRGQSVQGRVTASGLPPGYTPNAAFNVGVFGPYYAGQSVTCDASKLHNALAVNSSPATDGAGSLDALTVASGPFTDNQQGQIAYYAFVAIFPADASGRMDPVGAACVQPGNANILSVKPN